MSVLNIYIIITALAISMYYLFFIPLIEKSFQKRILQNMLHLELLNDLHNSIDQKDLQFVDSRSVFHPIRKSLLRFSLDEASIQKGASFVLFIKKWLLEDALHRKTRFNFYANQALYSITIHPNIKYGISQWIETFLQINPDYIDLEILANKKRISLCLKNTVKNDKIINLNSYLSNLAYDDLPGKLRISQKEYLIIEFKKR